PLLEALRGAFGSGSSFWTEHRYPTDKFFSYNVPFSEINASPNNTTSYDLMSQLIKTLKPVVAKSFPGKNIDGDVDSVEWWCHIRDEASTAAHQLHFDLDEVALAKRNSSNGCDDSIPSSSIHPLVSS